MTPSISCASEPQAAAFADPHARHDGRTPSIHKARHRRHANPFVLRHQLDALDEEALFGRCAPWALDIGCGPGEFTVALAQRYPAYNVLGVEIRPHFVAHLAELVKKASLQHCRALLANANLQLPSILPHDKVRFVSINFPDPWYKKRHHKRRVVSPAWLASLRPHLCADAELHAMTDYEPLAHAMREALDACGYLQAVGLPWPQHSTTGLSSERERTHMGRNQPIWRLAYRVASTQKRHEGGVRRGGQGCVKTS